jgi:hypothetical protein
LNHRYLIVTSNYTIDDLCTRNKIEVDDPVRDAIKRRFHSFECKYEYRYGNDNVPVPDPPGYQRFCIPEFPYDAFPMVDRFAEVPDTIMIDGSETSSELRWAERSARTELTNPTFDELSQDSASTEENEL